MKKILLFIILLIFVVANNCHALFGISLFSKKKYQLMEAAVQKNNKAIAQVNNDIGTMNTSVMEKLERIEIKFAEQIKINTQLQARVAAYDRSTNVQGDMVNTNSPVIFKDITKVLGGLCALLIIGLFSVVKDRGKKVKEKDCIEHEKKDWKGKFYAEKAKAEILIRDLEVERVKK